jgi:hypothetical protein
LRCLRDDDSKRPTFRPDQFPGRKFITWLTAGTYGFRNLFGTETDVSLQERNAEPKQRKAQFITQNQ